MILYPAMDLIEGKIVRLRQGRFDEVTYYHSLPAEAGRVAHGDLTPPREFWN